MDVDRCGIALPVLHPGDLAALCPLGLKRVGRIGGHYAAVSGATIPWLVRFFQRV